MDEIDELLSIRAAELYYEENKTQDEIGQALRLTRWKVGRLLAQAKQRGFIRIEILHPRARRLPIERRLRDERGLTDAIVVSTAGVQSPEELQERGGSATLLPSPAILERLATKEAIESDRVVAGVIELARSADAYVFSAGAADHGSVHVESGYLSAADVDLLVQKGAVGDVVGRY